MKLKITSAEVAHRKVFSKRLNKEYEFHEQSGLMELANGERRRVLVDLEAGQSAYPVGEYTVMETSFYVDRNNKLAIGRLHLAPVVSVADGGRRQAG